MTIATPPNAERLNALMRPADGVTSITVAHGILREISDLQEHQHVHALAYVFDVYAYARLSGSETPATEYPESFSDDALTDAFKESARRDSKIELREKAFLAMLAADDLATEEAAERVWKFLGSIREPPVRAFVLSMVLDEGSPCVARATRPEQVPYPKPDDDGFHRALWKHREVCKRIVGAIESSATKTSEGAIVFDLVHAIKDPRERAAVLGWALHQHRPAHRRDDPFVAEFRGLIDALLGVP